MKFLNKLFKPRKKVTYYWDEPKWTQEMIDEVENIFNEYPIDKSEYNDEGNPVWNIKLNSDIDLCILFDLNREIPYISFFRVDADLVWERHSKTWVEFEHCDTFDYLLERLRELPGAYGSKTLGKSYSRHCMDQADRNEGNVQ